MEQPNEKKHDQQQKQQQKQKSPKRQKHKKQCAETDVNAPAKNFFFEEGMG